MRTWSGVALLAIALPAQAQSPAERGMLVAWDDSLLHAATSFDVASLDRPSRHGSGRAGDIRRALFQVRRAELSGARGEIELVLTNMQVIANHSKWAWPHYVMARAFEVMARKRWVETLSDGKRPAERHSDAVWRTLRDAIERDPEFFPARRMLGRLAAASGDRFLRPNQVAALAGEVSRADADPDALLAWGRHLRALQDYAGAQESFTRSLQRGGDSSRLALEQARTEFALGEVTAANELYWAGVSQLSATGRAAYRADLWWITDDAELAAFDATPDSLVAGWLRRFWNRRDAEAANEQGDRLTEHLRRWIVAYQRYRALEPWTDAFWTRVEPKFDQMQGKWSCTETDAKLFEQLWRMPPTAPDDLRDREPILDHRGVMYLRHGDPIRSLSGGGRGIPNQRRSASGSVAAAPQAVGPSGALLTWSSAGMGEIPATSSGPLSESWVYWWDGEMHVVHFRGSDALGHYAATTLSENTPTYLMYNTALASSLPIAEYYAMAERTLANESSPFGPNGPRFGPKDDPRCFKEMMAVVDKTARDENAGIHRDSDTPPSFKGQYSVAQAFALGVASDLSGEVLATFAIPGSALTPEPQQDGSVGYTIALRIVAYDKIADRSVTVDTVRSFVAARPIGAREYLSGFTEFGLGAGTWQVATRAQQVGGGVVVQDVRQVRIDRGGGLALSDIVTGRPGTPEWLATDNAPYPINYPNGWLGGEKAELFYEVRGVPDGSSFRNSIEVRPIGAKGSAIIAVQSTDQSSGEVTRVRRTLGLERLQPGRYVVAVRIAYQGVEVTREREIVIVKP